MSREAQKQRIQTLMGMKQQETAAFSREAQIAQGQAMQGIGDIAGGIASGITAGMSGGGGGGSQMRRNRDYDPNFDTSGTGTLADGTQYTVS